MSLILLVGGARSGKSQTALAIAHRQHAPVVFLATGEGRDDEMAQRIARHRAERPVSWTTIEEPLQLMEAFESVPSSHCLVVDCLTLWTANSLERFSAPEIEEQSAALALYAAAREGTTVVVTNEVGLGIVGENRLARSYSDLLGRVNARWAEVATRVLFMVAGRALALESPFSLIEDLDEFSD